MCIATSLVRDRHTHKTTVTIAHAPTSSVFPLLYYLKTAPALLMSGWFAKMGNSLVLWVYLASHNQLKDTV